MKFTFPLYFIHSLAPFRAYDDGNEIEYLYMRRELSCVVVEEKGKKNTMGERKKKKKNFERTLNIFSANN